MGLLRRYGIKTIAKKMALETIKEIESTIREESKKDIHDALEYLTSGLLEDRFPDGDHNRFMYLVCMKTQHELYFDPEILNEENTTKILEYALNEFTAWINNEENASIKKMVIRSVAQKRIRQIKAYIESDIIVSKKTVEDQFNADKIITSSLRGLLDKAKQPDSEVTSTFLNNIDNWKDLFCVLLIRLVFSALSYDKTIGTEKDRSLIKNLAI